MNIIRVLSCICAAIVMWATVGCSGRSMPDDWKGSADQLRARLCAMVDSASGTVGIAVVGCGDTVTVNNGVRYPMMSVFKLHQSLAVAHALVGEGRGGDTILRVSSATLDRDTWSPMLNGYGDSDFVISVRRLVAYSLISSDNNASNILFDRIVLPASTDSFIRSVARDTTFSIRYTEAQMKRSHDLAYCNYSSPLSAALLIGQVFESDIVSSTLLDSIRADLAAVTTGADRLGAVVAGEEGVSFAHKTGSGYRNAAGELMAHNDVGHFMLPYGRSYSLAVMIRDYAGSEEEASRLMARISREVYNYFTAPDRGR